MNGSPQTVEELNDLPVKTVNGATIYMKDVPHVRDGFSPQTNIVCPMDARRAHEHLQDGTASTIEIVDKVKQMLVTTKLGSRGCASHLFDSRSMFALPSRVSSAKRSSPHASLPS